MSGANTLAGAYVRIGVGQRWHILRDDVNTLCGKRRLLGRDTPHKGKPVMMPADLCWACSRNERAHTRREKASE